MKCSICQQQTSIGESILWPVNFAIENELVCETKNLTKMVYQFPVAEEEDEAAEKKRKPPAAGNDYQPLCILDCRGLDIMETHLTGVCAYISMFKNNWNRIVLPRETAARDFSLIWVQMGSWLITMSARNNQLL
jgi:hypothetical protein